jgi:amino acid adenylation domain-containing protein/non-ribosomal peptide synthase protein (TIGR01720 family)
VAETETRPISGPIPLAPIQHWFFEQDFAEPWHWNMPVLLAVAEPLDPSLLGAVLQRLVDRHEALRLGFVLEEGAWHPVLAASAAAPLFHLDLSMLPEGDWEGALQEAASDLQRSLDLSRPPLLRAAWIDVPAGGRLLLMAHHLVVDAVSWRIVVEELEAGYRQMRGGEPVSLPALAMGFSQWTRALVEHAAAGSQEEELEHWLAETRTRIHPLPMDDASGRNTESSGRTLRVTLSAEQTRVLTCSLPRALGARVHEALLAALGLALTGWTGERYLLVEVEGHGREPLRPAFDPTRVVGWFATLFPVLLEIPDGASPREALEHVRERLQTVPARGIGYGLLRYLGSAGARAALREGPRPQILFNHLGSLEPGGAEEGLFALAQERIGPAVSPRSTRSHLLEINAWISEGRLEVDWGYSVAVHRPATITALAGAFRAHLESLIAGLAERDELEDVYPMSPLQEGMLFHSLYKPGAGMYVAQLVCELDGELRIDALTRAWEEVVQRHPVLRTAFAWQELDHPAQMVFRRVALPWSVVDLEGLTTELRRACIDEYLSEDRTRGFDVARPPLLRLRLFRESATRFYLVVSLHQMVLDGWSMPLVFEDVLALYEAACSGGRAELPWRRPYRDYIAWLAQQDPAQVESYWRRTLGGYISFHFPTDRELGDETYGEECLVLPEPASASVSSLARSSRITQSILLQAAWALLLGRYSGAEDVVFGTVVSGRPAELEGIESTVGLFINTLPVRIRVTDDLLVLSWLREIRDRQAEMHRYEHSSLPEVQRWAGTHPSLPLFESLLVFQNYPVAATLPAAGRALGVVSARTIEQTHYGLTLVVEPGRELRLTLSYPRRLFRRTSIQRLLRHLQTLLLGIGGARQIADVPFLTAEERHQVVREWNDTRYGEPERSLVPDRIALQAARTPERVAVVHEGQCLTYGELQEQAGRLARRLRAMDVGSDIPVAICMERSLETIVAVLGALQAGVAYLPLDPAQPRPRLRAILENALVPVVLTQERLLNVLPEGPFRVLCVDRPPEQCDCATGLPFTEGALPEGLAYVIFTSGSTGGPKGVGVEHRQLVHYVSSILRRLDLPDGCSFATVSSLATDLGNTAIFPALCSGGCLHLVSEQRAADPAAMEEYCGQHAVDVLKIVPSHLAALLTGSRPQDVLPRRRLVLGGEAAGRGLLTRVRELARECDIFNHYGPTETTVGVATYRLESCGNGIPQVFPIGRPLSNSRLLLLDRGGHPVPIGVPGEVFLGGRGLARGYIGQPGQTAERFVPDPWGGPGDRLYRTGDLARFLANGEVEFLGRIDHQVKVRGYRIETAEIEAVLLREEGVLEALVTALGETQEERRLVAYVVPRNGSAPSDEELHRRVREALPPFMLPSVFVRLETLPRTPSGKVDRRALPAPDQDRSRIGARAVAPRSALEEKLAEIWGSVLKISPVGVHDDFFALGGHSLLATQVTSRIRREFQVDFPLFGVFEQPTIADQAVLVAQLCAVRMASDEISKLLDELDQLTAADLETGTEAC